ncbi:MAG TPA: FeoA family protein [bacterium]|nr:FeoA family protein [bacterium]HPN42864.1 FeoA family protein [bacterium]
MNKRINMNLEQLTSGQQATITAINAEPAVTRRLVLLGFAPGRIVTMIKCAPFRDPLEVSINDGHLCIRRKEAAKISVAPVQETE